jgi:hypothetical protein
LVGQLRSLARREAKGLVDVDGEGEELTGELALEDRQNLDDAVLEMIGFKHAAGRRAIRGELYREITALYRQMRRAERLMQRFRSMTARGGHPSPQSIADEIWDGMAERPVFKRLDEFIPRSSGTQGISFIRGPVKVLRESLFHTDAIQVGDALIELGDRSRCELAKALIEGGCEGKIEVPRDPEVCKQILGRYGEMVRHVEEEFSTLAASYTSDDSMQERVIRELWKKFSRVAD